MSYEYKDLIAQSISAGEYRYAIEDEDYQDYHSARLELDHVYSQAAKADEYEVRAKAFDRIVEKYEGIMKEVRNRKFKVTSDVTLLGLEVEKVIKKYESGE